MMTPAPPRRTIVAGGSEQAWMCGIAKHLSANGSRMKRRLYLSLWASALLLSLGAVAIACGGGLSEAKRHNNRGDELAQEGRFEEAISEFGEAIELDPNTTEFRAMVYFNRGRAHAELGNFEEAVADFDKSIEADPVPPNPYISRGSAYLQLGDVQQAVTDFSRAIALDPTAYLAYNNRGRVYALAGDIELALADLDKAIELDLNNPLAYQNRGLLYAAIGDIGQAVADLQAALSLTTDPDASAQIARLIDQTEALRGQ